MFEAFDVLKGKTDPDADDLERVPYINAVISESNSLKKEEACLKGLLLVKVRAGARTRAMQNCRP